MNNPQIAATLETLERRLQVLDESNPPPRTVFDVVGVSRSESAWQHALAYFLNPDEPHGFGTRVLEAFLTLLEEHPDSSFEFYEYNLEDISIEIEASGDAGRPDIVLWLEDTWFLCIELKVDARETDDQTERYATASWFGDLNTTKIPSSGHHFVYLAGQHASAPAAEKFIILTWRDIVSAFSPLLNSGIMDYPARSVTQFHDFVRHIQHAFNMVTEQSPNPEKVELAFEHSTVLTELTDAANTFIEEYQADWDAQFEQDPPDGWTDEWTTIRHGNKWGRLVKTEWILPQNPSGEPQKTDGFSIAITIDMLQEDFERGETDTALRVYGKNEYTERYLERFHSDTFQRQIQPIIDETRLTVDDSSDPKPVKGTYPFEFDNGAGHLGALKEAFIEYNKIAASLEELYFDIRSEIEDPDQLFDSK